MACTGTSAFVLRGLACAAALFAALACGSQPPPPEPTSRLGVAQKLSEPSGGAATGDVGEEDGQWTMPAKNYASTRFSGLAEINAANVRDLKVAWTFSTGASRGHEAAPVVVGDTMYVTTPYPNVLYALDLKQNGLRPPRRASPAATQSIAARSSTKAGFSTTRSTRTPWPLTPRRAGRSGRPNSATSTRARR
jgi:glucose dehydrogenase